MANTGSTLWGVGSVLGGLGDLASGVANIKRTRLAELQQNEQLAMQKRKFEYDMKKEEDELRRKTTLISQDKLFDSIPYADDEFKSYLDKTGEALGVWQRGMTGNKMIQIGDVEKLTKTLQTTSEAAEDFSTQYLAGMNRQINKLTIALKQGEVKGKDAELAQQQLTKLRDTRDIIENQAIRAKLAEEQRKVDEENRKKAMSGEAALYASAYRENKGLLDPTARGQLEAKVAEGDKDIYKEMMTAEKPIKPDKKPYMDKKGKVYLVDENSEYAQDMIHKLDLSPWYKPEKPDRTEEREAKRDERMKKENINAQKRQYRGQKSALDREYAVYFRPDEPGIFATNTSPRMRAEYNARLAELQAEYDPEIFGEEKTKGTSKSVIKYDSKGNRITQ